MAFTAPGFCVGGRERPPGGEGLHGFLSRRDVGVPARVLALGLAVAVLTGGVAKLSFAFP